MSAHTEFDLGSLIWVKGEIDLALEKARQNLNRYAAATDAAELKFAQTHLHQVRGAVEMVGLSGAGRFAEELEVAIGSIERGEAQDGLREAVVDAMQSLAQYLEGLVNGAADLPLKLLPLYQQVRQLRGETVSSGADLFFPSLSAELPATLTNSKLDADALPGYLKNARSRYEAGFLRWIKGERHDGAVWMVQALFGVAKTQSSGLQRGFWWAAAALAEGSVDNRAKLDIELKQLFSRLNQQLRRLSESGGKVAERLFRDVLYAIAHMDTKSRQCAAVREAFGLTSLLPAGALADDAQQLAAMQLARELKEVIFHAKDSWARIGGGSADRLPSFRQQVGDAAQRGASLGIAGFVELANTLIDVLADTKAAPDEALALEVATTLLLLENALVVFPEFSIDFPAQSAAMQTRLREGSAAAPDVTLDDVSRRAQERLLMAQVAQEILTNLSQIEQTLDDFFRDASTRSELQNTDAPIRQIRGALTILDEGDALSILDVCAEIVKRNQVDDYTAPAEELEFLAEAFSSLGFYIDALKREEADRQKLIASVLNRIRGDVPAEAEAEQPTEAEQIAVEFASGPEAERDTTAAAAPAPVAPPAPAPSAPAPVSEAAVDAELLEVYLEEAVEVLDNVNSHLAILHDQPADKDALTVIRRGFHTLKGSGRMVGLNQLGEVAWAIEQVMNKWLQDERRATPSLLQLVGMSTERFGVWVEELKQQGTALVEASAIFTLAEQLKSGQEAEPEASAAVESAVEADVGSPAAPVELAAEAPPPVLDAEPEVIEAAPPPAPDEEIDFALDGDALTLAEPQADVADALPALSLDTLDEASAPEEVIDFSLDLPVDIASDQDAAALSDAVAADDSALDLVLDIDPPVAAVAVAEAGISETVTEAPALEIDLALSEQVAATLQNTEEDDSDAADIQIGDLSISRALFGIFLDEAYRHYTTLSEAFIDFSAHGQVEPAFVHAAHTLCGIANTTGFAKLGELGYAIEQVLLAHQQAGVALQQDDYGSLANAIDEVGVMLGKISHHVAPEAATQAVTELHALADRLKDSAHPLTVANDAITLTSADEELSLELDAYLPAESDVPAQAEDELILDLDAVELEPATESLLVESPSAELAAPEDDALVLEMPALETDIAFDTDDLVLELPVTEAAADLATTLVDEPTPATEPVLEQDLPPVIEAVEVEDSVLLDIGTLEADASDIVPSSDDVVVEVPAHEAEDASLAVDNIPVLLDEDTGSVIELDAPEVPLVDLPLADVDVSLIVHESAVDLGSDEAVMAAIADIAPAIETPAEAALPTSTEADGVGAVMHLTGADRLASITVSDELDEQLLPIFIEEMQELLPEVSSGLRGLRDNGEQAEVLDSLKRVLHTLKGSARMAGAMRLGEATHNMETRLLNAGEHLPPGIIDELDLDYDAIVELQDRLINGEPVAEDAATADASVDTSDASDVEAGGATAAAAPQAQAARAAAPAMALNDPDAGRASIRVRADLVDRLVNQAGEVAISRSRIESEMLLLKRSLLELTDNVVRLRGQLREVEIQAETQMQSRLSLVGDAPDFDPLEFDRFSRLQELTRFMAESVNDVATFQHNLLKNLDESGAALTQQARMTRDLQQELMRIRMVPFSSVSERLYRVVRQTGKETSKKVNLEIRGGRAEIDRSVLEKMVSPFEHMLRNAIDHGLEKPEDRLALGKNEFGEVVVEARQEGNELVLTLRDDGAGLNIERIRQKGLEKGLIDANTDYTDAQIMALIFEAGFSTASAVTQISGRGIGMDVVKSEIEELGGRVEVTSTLGKGTTFVIHLPLTLAVTQAVLVKVAGKLYAIPSVMVEQVQELKIDPLNQLYQQHQAEWQGNVYPFHYLPRLMGDYDSQPEQKRYNTIMLLRSGVNRIAVHVDELVKNQEVVVKNIGPQLVRVAGIAGATVLGNGEIVLIINPIALLQRRAEAPVADFDAAMAASAPAPEEVMQVMPLVMVVDDSLTVRKITSRLLAREGYQVETAKDGVDALQKLQDIRPAVMLLDVEMPRMDGFELTRNLRANADTRDIPIIMITSRTADKHKNYAFELGVNVFLGKPYQEDELMSHIQRLIANEAIDA